MFKLGSLLHSDLGKWKDAHQHVGDIVGADGAIINTLERTIADIHRKLDEVNRLINVGDLPAARKEYSALSASLKPDVVKLGEHIDTMDKTNRHIWKMTA